MRVWLIGLGLIGPEFKLVRALLGKGLSGSSAWRYGPPEKKAAEEAPAALKPAKKAPAKKKPAPEKAPAVAE